MRFGLLRCAPWLSAIGVLLTLLGTASCSLLPTWVPDLSRRALPAVPLVGAQGPLSAERSRAVLAALAQRGGVPSDIFERHLALEVPSPAAR